MPLICPSPHTDQIHSDQDCPLYAQRALTQAERLRRAVLRERCKPRTMAALVWADLNRQVQRAPVRPAPTPLPTRPSLPLAKGGPLPVLDLQKGTSHE